MFKKIIKILRNFLLLPRKIIKIQESLGRIEARQILIQNDLDQSEFRVFSQWGEDGIIQYLINNISISNTSFVEFGVENYLESNTRFLLSNNNWKGLVIDGSQANINYIKKDVICWAHTLTAVCEFITANNINSIIKTSGFDGQIGILSIDIDGNDYWIWDAINICDPSIVICEYNSHFGSEYPLTVPYQDDFTRGSAHYSKIYYGASILALTSLANSKGYDLVMGNSAGNNLFFVKSELLGNLVPKSPSDVYRKSRFRESHSIDGCLNYMTFSERIKLIKDLPLYNIDTCKNVTLSSLYNI